MIRRLATDGSLLVITQPAHAWLSGQIAERWGNERFPVPEPRDALLFAAHCHDAGWAEWEASPRIRPDGRPPNFTEMEVDEQLANWRRGIKIVNASNSYAAILVARHAAALLRGRLAGRSDPPETRKKIEAFLLESEGLIEQLSGELSAHPRYSSSLPASAAPRDFIPLRLLQIWDLISLLLCGGLAGPRAIESVPTDNGMRTVELRPVGEERFSASPWPFDCESFTVHVDARRLTRSTFESDDDFRGSLGNAASENLAFTFVRAG